MRGSVRVGKQGRLQCVWGRISPHSTDEMWKPFGTWLYWRSIAYQVSPFTREKSWLNWDPLVSIFPVSRKRAGNLALQLTSTTSTIATFNWSSMWSRLVPGQKKADPAGHDLRQQHARTRAALGQLPSGEVRRAQETSRCAIPCPFPSSPPPSRLPLPLAVFPSPFPSSPPPSHSFHAIYMTVIQKITYGWDHTRRLYGLTSNSSKHIHG